MNLQFKYSVPLEEDDFVLLKKDYTDYASKKRLSKMSLLSLLLSKREVKDTFYFVGLSSATTSKPERISSRTISKLLNFFSIILLL